MRYLVKPFAFPELLARVRALCRRAEHAEQGAKRAHPRQKLADLSLDARTRRAERGGREIELTPREFDLLAYLPEQDGQIVTREMLAREVWRESHRATLLDNVIDVHVAHLRRKTDDGSGRKLIHAVRGVGFMLREEPASPVKTWWQRRSLRMRLTL